MNIPITFVLPAAVIPDGTWVSKLTGEKQYKLCKRGIRLYHKDGKPVDIFGSDLILLTNPDNPSAINVVRPETKLKVQVATFTQARDLLDELEKQYEVEDTQ